MRRSRRLRKLRQERLRKNRDAVKRKNADVRRKRHRAITTLPVIRTGTTKIIMVGMLLMTVHLRETQEVRQGIPAAPVTAAVRGIPPAAREPVPAAVQGAAWIMPEPETVPLRRQL